MRHLGITAGIFEEYAKELRLYRNRYAGHSDPEKSAEIPDMALAKSATEFLLEHIAGEAAPGALDELDGTNIKAGYDTWLAEARELLSRHRH